MECTLVNLRIQTLTLNSGYSLIMDIYCLFIVIEDRSRVEVYVGSEGQFDPDLNVNNDINFNATMWTALGQLPGNQLINTLEVNPTQQARFVALVRSDGDSINLVEVEAYQPLSEYTLFCSDVKNHAVLLNLWLSLSCTHT